LTSCAGMNVKCFSPPSTLRFLTPRHSSLRPISISDPHVPRRARTHSIARRCSREGRPVEVQRRTALDGDGDNRPVRRGPVPDAGPSGRLLRRPPSSNMVLRRRGMCFFFTIFYFLLTDTYRAPLSGQASPLRSSLCSTSSWRPRIGMQRGGSRG